MKEHINDLLLEYEIVASPTMMGLNADELHK